jgi:hypothetical protein
VVPIQLHGRIAGVSALVLSLITVACGGGSPTAPGAEDFQGVWQGQWQRTSCSETGGATGVACNVTPTTGALRLTLTQTGSTVQGNVEVASFIISASGSVSAGGSLTLTGSAHLQSATQTLSNWNTTRSGNSMNGAFTLTVTADNPALGTQVVVLTLQNVTKTS